MKLFPLEKIQAEDFGGNLCLKFSNRAVYHTVIGTVTILISCIVIDNYASILQHYTIAD